MAEWLFEAGVGEDRAALVDDGDIIEARIAPHGEAIRAGAVLDVRLIRAMPETRRALVRCEASGAELLVSPVPRQITEGGRLLVEVVREAIPEPGNPKLPQARPAAEGAQPGPGPDLLARIMATGLPVRQLRAHEDEALEAAGWSEVIESAATGLIPFPGGLLRMALTPAMTIFDVDGSIGAEALARAGAEAAARAIRRFDIGGSIGIDLPSAGSKEARQAAAAAFDAALPQPFERTAVNGFGFLQIIRRRERPSLPERLQSDPVGAAARALLRRAERESMIGARRLAAHPGVIAAIARIPGAIEELGRRTGASIGLRERPDLPISGGHVEPDR